MDTNISIQEKLSRELEELRRQLYESQEALEVIRTGGVDALVVQNGSEHHLYTLESADHAYRVFIEKMSEGAVTLNHDGVIYYANSQFAQMVGYPLSEIIGFPFSQFIQSDKKASFDKLLKVCWKEEGKAEAELASRQGQLIPVQLSLTPLDLKEGKSLSIILTDLTSQKAAQKQLQEKNYQLQQLNQTLESSNYDLHQFASVASHDLQEPLRKIQIFINLLKTNLETKLSRENMVYLDKILASSNRMKTLISDVLGYSKLSADSNEFSRTDLNVIVSEVLEDFEIVIEERAATITYTNLPVIEANQGQIKQVFQNLISNSLKFSRQDTPPRIKISSEWLSGKYVSNATGNEAQYCMILFEDNGIGFDEKYIPNIFALFERLNPKDEYEGTGIGLAITKKIVEKHQGVIDVKSDIGKGTTFQIILPVHQKVSVQ